MNAQAPTILEKAFVSWLFWETDPGTGRYEPTTIKAIAQEMGVGRNRMSECVNGLADRGVIRAHLPGRHDGWIEIVGYHRMMNPSEWLRRQMHVVRADTTRTGDRCASKRRARSAETRNGSSDLRASDQLAFWQEELGPDRVAIDEPTGNVIDIRTGEVLERAS